MTRILGVGGSPASEVLTHTVYGSTLLVGYDEHIQRYVEPCDHKTPQEAQEGVCKKALDLNVLGFISWLHKHEHLLGELIQLVRQLIPGSPGRLSPSRTNLKNGSPRIVPNTDWQKQLERKLWSLASADTRFLRDLIAVPAQVLAKGPEASWPADILPRHRHSRRRRVPGRVS